MSKRENGVGEAGGARRARLAERDRLVASRFWYWSEVKRVRYDDVLRILGEREFFLDERTVQRALLRAADVVSGLEREAGALRRLKREHPCWNWGVSSDK